ncbi:hypothetical protein QA645_33620 [Bradyrhizobium sp. CIAT3101]|uniref:hypothetical protein n=1 Tax=Bradyrhizobium sp. CIAT3101 TaxID=439387 RepID=UPI0024B0969E|nr:hypothetical protein [Bradyrhizobium sp. CIAT3101]WFU79397.1 hypothetical protein QA645_33620 [Bradyrhizobium sp. CIAT3101]
MVDVIWMPATEPSERHIVVRVHRMGQPPMDKGYFFVSDETDWKGSGPFDLRLDEVIERAKSAAREKGLSCVVVTRAT